MNMSYWQSKLTRQIAVLLLGGFFLAFPSHLLSFEYMLMDFETAELHDNNWLSQQPNGTVGTVVDDAGGTYGPNIMSLAPGEGLNGSTALAVTSTGPYNGLPNFWLMNSRSGNPGSVGRSGGDDIYLLPRGLRANFLQFSMRVPPGFREIYSSTSTYHTMMTVGTYNKDPNDETTNFENNNWHFYHALFYRFDQSQDNWITVRMYELPQSQRNNAGNIPINPLAGYGNYFETMTRFYIQHEGARANPQIPYPFTIYFDEIKFLYIDPPKDITIRIEDFVDGQQLDVQMGVDTTLQATITNNSASPISGNFYRQSPYWLRQSLLDESGNPMGNRLTLAPGETKNFQIRMNPETNLPEGYLRHVGVAFTPDSQRNSGNNGSFIDPNVEQRYNALDPTFDGFAYGAFVRVKTWSSISNRAPTALGGQTYYYRDGSNAIGQLQAVDPEGETVTFQLVSQPTNGGNVNIDPVSGNFVFVPDGSLAPGDAFKFKFKATDSNGNDSIDHVIWIYNGDNPIGPNGNQAPLVSAGQDQIIVLPNPAQLAGNVVDDGLPNPPGSVSITWQQTSGPAVANISDPTIVNPTITFPQDGDYIFSLTANDGAASRTAGLKITVLPEGSTPPGSTGNGPVKLINVVRDGNPGIIPCQNTLRIFDKTGNLVNELACPSNGAAVWTANGRASGLYYIQEDGVKTRKIINLR